jgi:hypothetical protein
MKHTQKSDSCPSVGLWVRHCSNYVTKIHLYPTLIVEPKSPTLLLPQSIIGHDPESVPSKPHPYTSFTQISLHALSFLPSNFQQVSFQVVSLPVFHIDFFFPSYYSLLHCHTYTRNILSYVWVWLWMGFGFLAHLCTTHYYTNHYRTHKVFSVCYSLH